MNADEAETSTGARREKSSGKGSGKGKQNLAKPKSVKAKEAASPKDDLWAELEEVFEEQVQTRKLIGTILCAFIFLASAQFLPHCWALGQNLSEPQIMLRGRGHDGSSVIIDDFRESYWWLRDNTPLDARVMAWWDYGYQINGVANRTSIADGNTWNHEHIALLGKCLVSDEETSHAIVRHLADYVLVWTTRYAGMYSDDLAKSPHMARIAGSVYSDISPMDFYMTREGVPSKMMQESLLWRLHHANIDPKVPPLIHFEEAYTTRNRMVRIFKVLGVSEESKEWRAKNGPGYPPALKTVLEKKQDFKQIHGF